MTNIRYLTCIVFGTGEKINSHENQGILHEFLMDITKSKIKEAPSCSHFNHTRTIEESINDSFSSSEFNQCIANIRENENQILVPAPKMFSGSHFIKDDLLVINGVTSSKIKNIIENFILLPFLLFKRINKEVSKKSDHIADFYYNQIIALDDEDPNRNIKLLITGFSRGSCIAIQAINKLYMKLQKNNHSNIIDKIDIKMFLLDPVPGSSLVSENQDTHNIPSIVSELEILLSEHELRNGFDVLRPYYLADIEKTKIVIRHLPGNHSSLKRLIKKELKLIGNQQDFISPCQYATFRLESIYFRFKPLEKPLNLLHYVKADNSKSQSPAQRLPLPKEVIVDYSDQINKHYLDVSHQHCKKTYSLLTPLFIKHRKLPLNHQLEYTDIIWPSKINQIKKKLFSVQNTSKKSKLYVALVSELDNLIKHSYRAKSQHNRKILYSNFDSIMKSLDELFVYPPSNNQSEIYELVNIRNRLENIYSQSQHNSIIKRIISSLLSIISIILSIGLLSPYVYRNVYLTNKTSKISKSCEKITNEIISELTLENDAYNKTLPVNP